jgi:hypothetical protein
MPKTRKKSRRVNRHANRVPLAIRPPQLRAYPELTHTYRFFCNTTVTNVVISNDLLFGAAGGICTIANSKITCIFGTLKVKRVQIWAPLLTSGANVVELLWGTQAQSNSNPIRISDVSVSTMYPAHIDTRPPKDSLASFWQIVSVSNNLFEVSCPVGSYIDVTLQLTLWNNEGAGFQTTVGLATLADMYYMSLDGPTNHDLQPVSLNTTN